MSFKPGIGGSGAGAGAKGQSSSAAPDTSFFLLPFSPGPTSRSLSLSLSSPLPPFLSPLRLPLRLASCQQMTSPFMFGAEHGFECSFDSVKIIAGSLSDAD